MNTPNKTLTVPQQKCRKRRKRRRFKAKYVLVSGVERNRIAPLTFNIPPQSARESLRPGHLVKLWFHLPDDSPDYHMWVLVGDAMPGRPGYYDGLLYDCPLTDCIRMGDRVEFHSDHVLDIDRFSWTCWLLSLLHSVLRLARRSLIGAHLPF